MSDRNDQDRRNKDRRNKDRRDREERERQERNSAPTLNYDGSLKMADLGGEMAIGSDGNIHFGGIDLQG